MQDDDKTIIMTPLSTGDHLCNKPLVANGLQVTLINSSSNTSKESIFFESFTIGRGRECDFMVVSNMVSRQHVKINIEYGEWYIQDLGSTNGVYVNDVRIAGSQKLIFPSIVHLGKGGSLLQFQLVANNNSQKQEADIADDVTQIIQNSDTSFKKSSLEKLNPDDIQRRFFSENNDNAGEYTQMVRGVIINDKKKNAKKYRWGISIVFLLLCIAVGVIIFQQINYRDAALKMYYQMKSLEVNVSLLEIQLKNEASSSLQNSITLTRQKLKETQNEYNSIIDSLNAFEFPARMSRIIRSKIGLSGLSEYERELIQKVAEKFGESQLELSDSFIVEVHNYILKWQHSSRMENAMARLGENNYAPIIRAAMKKEGLPAQFLYLCLQESNFDSRAIGPETRYGIAKGAWQFLPETGQEFGLSTGAMVDSTSYDSLDERFNFSKATNAAAKYLKHIYSTEAQASGLLVMASYNYGHNRVRRMIRNMPNNPKERNFWSFIKQYEIPDETYQYVLYIFSAAVIGEGPKYFGFDFNSPV
jgi:pSer/pThr/pTyr-binding forkhead associated (FHA) protein/soluble lytic murein transglycosylase-like protein